MAAAGRSSAFNIARHSKRKETRCKESSSNETKGNASMLLKGLSLPNISSTTDDHFDLNGPGKVRKDILKRKSFRLSLKKSKKPKHQPTADQPVDNESRQPRSQRNSMISSVSSETTSITSDVESEDFLSSVVDGQKALQWLINPVTIGKFFEDVWEKKPLYIRRRKPAYNEQCFSTKEFDAILRKDILRFTENIDVTSYTNGVRQTLNPDGRALADTIWDFYNKGCSVRLLNPQTFSNSVWKLTSLLQEYFGSFVGANVYLTPPSSQGFAPHYDDIEAFVIQLEGKKHWRLYQPRTAEETLPQHSSKNFSDDDVGSPILDRILEAGDVLYFPRGYIHQARSLEDTHSLHITISVYQKQSWGHFLEKVLSRALPIAMEEDVEFRQGVPINLLDHLGVAFSNQDSADRSTYLRTINHLLTKMLTYCPIDAAADQFAVDRIQAVLPPLLTKEEQSCTVFGNGAFWGDSSPFGHADLLTSTHIRLLRPGIARLAYEGDQILLYHSLENSRVYCERPSHVVEIEEKDVGAVEQILTLFPQYISISDLQCDTRRDKLSVAKQLYERGIIRTMSPLAQDSII